MAAMVPAYMSCGELDRKLIRVYKPHLAPWRLRGIHPEVPVKLRALALAAALLTVCGSANAFFFIIPLGAIQNAVQGGHCVPATAKPGDRINVGGKNWVVRETNGVSSRCSQYPNWPVIAKLEPYVSEAELAEEVQVCLPQGASEGSRTSVSGFGEVYVKAVNGNGTDCSDMRTPVSARVVRVRGASQPVSQVPPADSIQPQSAASPVERPKTATLEPTPSASTDEPPKQIPVVAAQQPLKQPRTVAERLRELKQLRDENLITESVYESKQREILSGQ